jgi:cytochrome c peroxidase
MNPLKKRTYLMKGSKVFLSFAAVTILAFVISAAQAVANDLTPAELLGKFLFFDKISSPDSMACADCHAPSTGFTGPVPGINKHGAVYRGAVPQRFGNRKPPSAAYATLSPVFHYDADEELFVGGNFWDGRATGERLGNPAADQALGPFLNPVEQNNPSKRAVLEQIAASSYAPLWEEVWGEPISLETEADVEMNYDRVGLAIEMYEASSEVNQFSSKYDYYLAGMVDLTEQEQWGLELFNGKAMCSACHISEPGPGGEPPLFTDFTFDNLGVPKNPKNPFYNMDKVFLDDGTPISPAGAAWIDPGLGGFLQTRSDYQYLAAENMGKHKVPTLRNVDKRPGEGFPKAYMHNGVFKSLKEVVHFYNTRDVENWPPPEVPENVNHDELGDLGLTAQEEAAIVVFMKTLSDGYTP